MPTLPIYFVRLVGWTCTPLQSLGTLGPNEQWTLRSAAKIPFWSFLVPTLAVLTPFWYSLVYYKRFEHFEIVWEAS